VPDPARPTQPQPPHKPRLAPYLADEIRRGLVAVDDRADRSIVTILGDGLFRPGEATVGAREQWLLSRIGDALFCVPGQVDVVGHTDNAPIRTLRFPSNWELSKARAESVAHPLSNLVPPARLRAHGRGDAEPVAPNETPEGRARNRRVEITLHVPAAASPVPTPEPPRGPRCPSPA
jgi:type VI secretion system protein ImpK